MMLRYIISTLVSLLLTVDFLAARDLYSVFPYQTPVLQLAPLGNLSAEDSLVYQTLIREFEEAVDFCYGDTLKVIGRNKWLSATKLGLKRAEAWREFLLRYNYPQRRRNKKSNKITVLARYQTDSIISDADDSMLYFTDVRLSPYREKKIMNSLLVNETPDPQLFGLQLGKTTLQEAVKSLNVSGKHYKAVRLKRDFTPSKSDTALVVDSISYIQPWNSVYFIFNACSTLYKVQFVKIDKKEESMDEFNRIEYFYGPFGNNPNVKGFFCFGTFFKGYNYGVSVGSRLLKIEYELPCNKENSKK